MEQNEYRVMAKVELTHWWFVHRYHRIRDIIYKEWLKKNNSLQIFDAGCGTGGLIRQLKNEIYVKEVRGCEPQEWAHKYMLEMGLNVLNCRIEEMINTKDKFDIVLCMDVFYHRNLDPNKAILALSNILKPGGILILNVAAMKCLKRAHDEKDWGARRYLPYELKSIIDKVDFNIMSLKYWNSWLTPFIWMQSMWYQISTNQLKQRLGDESALNPPPIFVNRMLIILLKIEQYFSKFVPLPFGSSLMAVARKEFI